MHDELTLYNTQIKPRFAERVVGRVVALNIDFKNKAGIVIHNITDLMQIRNGESTILLQTYEFRNDALKKNAFLQKILARLKETQEKDVPQDTHKYATDIMSDFKRLVRMAQEEKIIPDIFKGYTVNNDLKQDGSYFPDGTIEDYETNIEPLIVAELQKANEQKTLPENI